MSYKLNKKTLIIAAIVILLCLVSITGATFALFTASTEDGTIGVNATSARMEIDIIDATENPSSIVGGALNFVTTQAQDSILFEPGATYHTEGFRIMNRGSIPVDFIVYISEDETVADDFFDGFEVFITKDPTSRDAMVKMQDFYGELEKDKASDIYFLVFRMLETADNDFQEREFTGVGITVCAVQGNGYIEKPK